MTKRTSWFFCFLVLLALDGYPANVELRNDAASGGKPEASLRSEVCLNGIWQLEVDGIDEPAEVQVPGSFAGQDQLWGKEHWDVWDYPKQWFHRAATYRRTIRIPADLDNQRVLIHFGGVRHVVRVEVNGKEAGNWSDSYVPFEFDITELVQAGDNELRVHIGKEQTCGLFEDYNRFRRGIYRDVFVKFVPEVRVTPDLFVKTSVTDKILSCEVPVRNDSAEKQDVSLRFNVMDAGGNVVLSWDAKERAAVAPGEVKILEVSRLWKDPHLWSIDDPYLYHLETEVVDAKNNVLDRHTLRFGFRELSWANAQLKLNGREIFLRGHGGHPLGDLQGGREYSRLWIKQLKAAGVEVMRLHNLARHAEIYEAADELGFLLISEASHHFRLPEKEVAMAHMGRLVKWLRNHPSVIMWSVANELHWRKFEEPVYLIELCNQLDPTRPAFNSDYSAWSLHGDVLAHHYDAGNIWNDWQKYGPDKVMVYDELGSVWQHDRPLKPGPAGHEISSQDVATGIWRDGWEQVRNDIEIFADGEEFNGRFNRVNLYCPWEFSYVFYRFLPFNNFQRFYPEYEQIEGAKEIKPKFINPCSTTINLWDPTLPQFQPNPGYYCFSEYLERVRFPDDPKERTFFSGETVARVGRLFYEDPRPADQVEFRVESPDGEVLTSVERDISLAAGEYVSAFKSEWELPEVDDVTPVRLVRQFSHQGETGYRKVDEAKLFPVFVPVDLTARKVAVVGKALQKQFGGAGVPVDQARIIVAETHDPAWDRRVAGGVNVLVQPVSERAGGKQLSYCTLVPKGARQVFSGPVDTCKVSDNLTLNFGTPGQERSTLSHNFTIDNPMPGAWMTLGFDGVVDFSRIGRVNLAWGLWTPPGKDGYEKTWEDAGGTPFFRKTVRLMLRDASGRWFVSGKQDAGVLTREAPQALRGTLEFDGPRLAWKPVRLEPGAVVETGEAIKPDFSAVSALGLVFDETNPGSPVQINSFTVRGGGKPGATVQPGGVSHRLLTGLGQEDFSFWRGGSCLRTIALPERRNVRRILMGNKDGVGSALQETFMGRGIVLESSLNAANLQEPVAGFLLNRMLDYLEQVEPAPVPEGISVPGGGPLADWLAGLGADLAAESRIVAVDARQAEQLAASKPALVRTLRNGGTVLFSEVTPESIGLVREITGKPLRLTKPYFGQLYKCIKAPVSWARVGTPKQWVDYYDGILVPYPFEPNYSPLLAGIANFDLDWNNTKMFIHGVEIEGMNPVSATADHQILISNWHIGSEGTDHLYGEMLNGVRDLRQNSWFVNRDAVVMELAVGNGRVLISQLDLTAGGDPARRLMQTLLTNLGVSFGGAMPPPASDVYDSADRSDQLARFARYDRQIAPVIRQHYGLPDPMPDYLKATQILSVDDAGKLPLLGFFGDALTLGLARPLETKLADVVSMDPAVVLADADQLKEAIGDKNYARVVFSFDPASELSADAYVKQLEDIWKLFAQHSQKIYWVPAPSAYGTDEMRAARGREFNRIAAEFFEDKEVYMLPFVYADTDKLPSGYFSGTNERFTPAEASVLAERLGEAVISFGAQ
jgi:hypothetical protein